MEYAIIRPGGLKDTPGRARKLILSQDDHLLGMISRSDLAEICLRALQYPHTLRVTFEVIEDETQDKAPGQLQFASLAMD